MEKRGLCVCHPGGRAFSLEAGKHSVQQQPGIFVKGVGMKTKSELFTIYHNSLEFLLRCKW